MRMYICTFPRMQALKIGCTLIRRVLERSRIRPNRSHPQQRQRSPTCVLK